MLICHLKLREVGYNIRSHYSNLKRCRKVKSDPKMEKEIEPCLHLLGGW